MLAVAAAVLFVLFQAQTAQAAAERANAARRKAVGALAELDQVRTQTVEQLAACRTSAEQAQSTARNELDELRAAAAKAVTDAQAVQERADAAQAEFEKLIRTMRGALAEAATNAATRAEPDQAMVPREHTQAGLSTARSRGLAKRRTPKMTPELVAKAQRMYDSRRHTMAEIAQSCGVSSTTIYRHIRTGQPRRTS